MFPGWHDNMHVPSVGDIVHIGHTITVDANTVRPESFRVSVQPRTPTGVLSDRGRAIAALLRRTHGDTAKFLDRYLRPNIGPAEVDCLRVDLKNLLENHRSALEYTAHHIADFCTPKPPLDRVYFPVAKLGDTTATFARKLDQWFPNLSTSAPKVREYLLSVQEFSGDPWLRQLADLTNFNKHRSLSAQEPGDFLSVVVRFGDAGVRFGELGLRSLSLEAGGVLRFVNSAGQQADLKDPCVIDANTTSLPDVDPRIEVLRENRQLYRIPGHGESIAGTIWSINTNVFRAVDQICKLLSQPA